MQSGRVQLQMVIAFWHSILVQFFRHIFTLNVDQVELSFHWLTLIAHHHHLFINDLEIYSLLLYLLLLGTPERIARYEFYFKTDVNVYSRRSLIINFYLSLSLSIGSICIEPNTHGNIILILYQFQYLRSMLLLC